MTTQEHPDPLETRALRFMHEHLKPAETRPVVVAVSGGPDSMCLLHVLAGLRDRLRIQLHVAHLNHRLRGNDSDSDAAYVQQAARSLGLPVTIGSRDVSAHRAAGGTSLEEAAREVRYGFLAEVARTIGARVVAVGHTRDDHVETILMHLIRGTGTRGLRGLLPVSRWPFGNDGEQSIVVIRPLLDITREETASYCRVQGLDPRADKSNDSTALFRNRIRLELLPLLRSYNRDIESAFLRASRIATDELAFLDNEVRSVWNSVAAENDGAVIFDKGALLALHPALKRNLLRLAFERLAGSLKDVEARHVEALMRGLDLPAGSSLDLPAGLVFTVEYTRYLLGPVRATSCPFPAINGEFRLDIPGQTRASGWQVKASVVPAEQVRESALEDADKPMSSLEPAHISGAYRFTSCLDFDRVGSQLVMRSVRPGDRFMPLGLGREKKVGRFMLDARIPRAWRSRIPIVASPQRIVCVAGWRVDDNAKLTDQTVRALLLEFTLEP